MSKFEEVGELEADEKEVLKEITELCKEIEQYIESSIPASPELSNAKRYLRQFRFWAREAIEIMGVKE